MKHQIKPLECPHNWSDCSLCSNLTLCQSGTYVPEPEPVEPEPVPDLTPGHEELTTDLGIVIPQERGTWFEKFSKLSPNLAGLRKVTRVQKYLLSRGPPKSNPSE